MLRGNHEQEFLNLLRDASTLQAFLDKGGRTFLKSFSVDHPAEIPEKYVEFMKGLDWYFSLPDYILVHAGFDFSKKKPFTICEDILNIREYKVKLDKTEGRKVLHGHTPTNIKKIIKRLTKGKKKHISLDAGCPYRSNEKQGCLLALNLDEWRWIVQENVDYSDNYSE
jgi:serine/threonine protein phosphatase 1